MEELFPVLIFLFIGIVNTISKAKKKEQTAAKRTGSPWKSDGDAVGDNAPAPSPTLHSSMLPPMTFSDIPGQVITPTVHPHVQPDCDTHDKPGSLGVTSLEGKDPCHEEQLLHPRTSQNPDTAESGMTFDWTGESMVKAFVMQEILTRPCQRQAR